MKSSKYIKFIFAIMWILSGGEVYAQTTLQVVTKTVERSLNCPLGTWLNIDADKSDISIKAEPHIKDIKIKMELIAKNPNLQNAKNDINAIKYEINPSGKNIYIHNYVGIDKGENKLTSELKVRYTIILPNYVATSVKNNFGKITISDLKNDLSLRAEFCKLNLVRLKGKIGIEIMLSDLQSTELEGELKIQSIRSELMLSINQGTCNITAQSGKIKVIGERGLSQLIINGYKTEVYYMPPLATSITYDLNVYYGKILIPAHFNLQITDKTNFGEKIVFRHYKPYNNLKPVAASVFIKTQFNNIEIGAKP